MRRKSPSVNHWALCRHGVAGTVSSATASPSWSRTPGRIVTQSIPAQGQILAGAAGLDGMALLLERLDDVDRVEAERLPDPPVVFPRSPCRSPSRPRRPMRTDATGRFGTPPSDTFTDCDAAERRRRRHSHQGVQIPTRVGEVVGGVVHGMAHDPGAVDGVVTDLTGEGRRVRRRPAPARWRPSARPGDRSRRCTRRCRCRAADRRPTRPGRRWDRAASPRTASAGGFRSGPR